MDGKIRRIHSEQFKLKVALAALKADKTVNEMCQEFAVCSARIYEWKKQIEERGVEVFASKNKTINYSVRLEKLHAIIGKLVVERELLAKKIER